MTGEKFKRLKVGDEVWTLEDENDYTYQVRAKDRMGRVKMQRIVYEINNIGFFGEEYDTEEEAYDALERASR